MNPKEKFVIPSTKAIVRLVLIAAAAASLAACASTRACAAARSHAPSARRPDRTRARISSG
ncbi:MAG: hypothetical protein RLZZ141_1746, partial [Pseudomonadota bacterium]